jgi:two-component system response regulator NreC
VSDPTGRRIRVLIADDHTLLRDGIRALLADEPDIDVVGEAEDGRWAVERACKLRPDVVLMDIAMPLLNGLEATRQIKRDSPETHVLILTMHEDAEYVGRVLEAGAAGYVLKHAAGHELVAAIRAVAGGGAFFSPSIARHVLEGYVSRREGAASPDPYDELTPREREVLQLIAEGYTNRDIAGMLTLSIKTVKTHRLHLMHKLNIHDRGELVRYAIQKGIIQP